MVSQGADEAGKEKLVDQLDATATESLCQVGSMTYRAQFAQRLQEIQGGPSEEPDATMEEPDADGKAAGGEYAEEEAGEDDPIVEPPRKQPKPKKLPKGKAK